MFMVKIYALKCPISLEVRYVGKTSQSLSKRMNCHRYTYDKSHRTNWFKSLKEKGFIPIIELIEEVEENVWPEKERFWIAHFKAQGAILCNGTDGGRGGRSGVSHSEETRRKMSLAQKGKKVPPEVVAKTKATLMGRIVPDDQKAKMRIGQKIRWEKGEIAGNSKLTPEIVQKIRNNIDKSTLTEMARAANVSKITIWHIKKRHTWKHFP